MGTSTLKCRLCLDERPDSKISVLSKAVHIHGVVVIFLIPYCNDRPDCIQAALDFSFFKNLPKP